MRPSRHVAPTIAAFVCALIVAGPAAALPQYPGNSRYQASARIQVTPKEAEVYLDGYLVGTVDDFDGFAQRLRVDRGEHEIVLYLKGHRLVRQLIFFQLDETYQIKHAMEPLAAGETEPDRPTPSPDPAARRDPGVRGHPSAPPGPWPVPGPIPPPSTTSRDPAPGATAGTISIRVQPADASVVIDGERWEGSVSGSRLQVLVTPGDHRVEVRKDGYQPFTTTVAVRPGETVTLNVGLTKAGG